MTKTDNTWYEIRARLDRYVRSKVDVDVSEDLVHDILVQLLKNEQKLGEVDDPLAWIYTVARNRITDHYRKQARTVPGEQPDNMESINAGCEAMPDCVDVDFASWLRPIAEKLEPKYREAILLVDFNQKAQAEAAEEIGITLPAMKSRVQRARSYLKENLLACCAIELDRYGKPIDYEKNKNENVDDRCC